MTVAPAPLAVAVTLSPTKLTDSTEPADPTIEPSSSIVMPLTAPAPELTLIQLTPPPPVDART